jgi:hypothetical protein
MVVARILRTRNTNSFSTRQKMFAGKYFRALESDARQFFAANFNACCVPKKYR